MFKRKEKKGQSKGLEAGYRWKASIVSHGSFFLMKKVGNQECQGMPSGAEQHNRQPVR
jgi:hypothetical protein